LCLLGRSTMSSACYWSVVCFSTPNSRPLGRCRRRVCGIFLVLWKPLARRRFSTTLLNDSGLMRLRGTKCIVPTTITLLMLQTRQCSRILDWPNLSYFKIEDKKEISKSYFYPTFVTHLQDLVVIFLCLIN